MQKVTDALFSLKEAIASFAPQGFVTKCFLIFIVDEVKNFAANISFKLVCQSRTGSRALFVSHVLGSVQKGGVHILKNLEVLKWQKVSAVSSSMGIIESRDKGFVLDLKLLFTIVDCFLGRFPPRFFTMKLVCFTGFPGSSYLVLFTFPLCMILMFVCFNSVGLKLVNYNKSNLLCHSFFPQYLG